jgi:hypothetical protein
VKIVGDKIVLRALNAGFGKSTKKFDVFSIKEEHAMFSQMIYQPTFPYGLNLRFGYFCVRNFFIYGYFELQNVEFEEFASVQLPTNLVLKFCQGISKNWCINVTKCSTN